VKKRCECYGREKEGGEDGRKEIKRKTDKQSETEKDDETKMKKGKWLGLGKGKQTSSYKGFHYFS
jgi:hypothetical protein